MSEQQQEAVAKVRRPRKRAAATVKKEKKTVKQQEEPQPKPVKKQEQQPRKPRTPTSLVAVGKDEKGNELYQGPQGGVFRIKTTKSEKQRRTYLKELNKGVQKMQVENTQEHLITNEPQSPPPPSLKRTQDKAELTEPEQQPPLKKTTSQKPEQCPLPDGLKLW